MEKTAGCVSTKPTVVFGVEPGTDRAAPIGGLSRGSEHAYQGRSGRAGNDRHEAIYQTLYIQGRGALKRELSARLRSGRALRLPRERARNRGKPFLSDALMISDRSAEIDDSAVPVHSLPGSAFAKKMSREGGG